MTVDHSGPRHSPGDRRGCDGVREMHCNTMEGAWTELRDFLRAFRGASKWSESQYVAMFQWDQKIKEVSGQFLRIKLELSPYANFAS